MAVVSLGANLGNPAKTVREAIQRLAALSPARPKTSALWRTSPVDCPPGAPPFVNAVVAFTPHPGESPASLFDKLQSLEKELGRTRTGTPNEPRIIDLDLIAMGAHRVSTPELTLPHPRAHLRRFVLAPLVEILPEFQAPGWTACVSELLFQLRTPDPISRLDA